MNQEPNTFESSRKVNSDEILKSDPLVDGLEVQDLDKTINAPGNDIADHLDFFNDAASAARNHVRIDMNPSDAVDISVNHPSDGQVEKSAHSTRNKVLAGAGVAAAIAGAAAIGAGPIASVVDEHFEHQSEQNKQWSDEAEEAQRQFDNGTIVIDLPPENK